jgi:3-isopropylmalate dehydrogenase
MFGDIITDLAAMIQGGLGVAAGGNINPDPGGVSMFEPMGGSAPKYTGQNVINPIAAISAMSMLLTVTGQLRQDPHLTRAGERVERALIATCPKMESQNAGRMGYTTQQVGDLVCEAL